MQIQQNLKAKKKTWLNQYIEIFRELYFTYYIVQFSTFNDLR